VGRASIARSMSRIVFTCVASTYILPGVATAARLPRNGFVTLDFGVILKGYCSDMTRTVYLGKPKANERNAYEAVLEAQEAGVAAVGSIQPLRNGRYFLLQGIPPPLARHQALQ